MSRDSLTLFTWGYDGCGNWTGKLVEAVDVVERSGPVDGTAVRDEEPSRAPGAAHASDAASLFRTRYCAVAYTSDDGSDSPSRFHAVTTKYAVAPEGTGHGIALQLLAGAS